MPPKITVTCPLCDTPRVILKITADRCWKKHGNYRCASCAAKLAVKPQNSPTYWTATKRANHGAMLKVNENYQTAITLRDTSGSKNSMFGKKASIATRQKMSASRTGKTGVNATAWKGGKRSLNERLKRALGKRYNWSRRVFARDGYQCTRCPHKGALDAHHLEPFARIIKRLLPLSPTADAELQFEWLLHHPDIADPNLENGVTLCRSCHRKAHHRWGSHHPKVV
jgi:hypothetical protein